MKPGVSIVIVTYNGSARLLPTLTHIAQQNAVNFDIEVVLVDNNSSDGTALTCETTWQTLGNPFPLRIVKEEQPGTMYARKKGIETSNYRYILYCDDDNWLTPDYVSIAYASIRLNENIAAVGGCGFIEYEQGFTVPSWMEDYKKHFGTGPQGEQDGDTTHTKGCLYTAGTILDKKWLSLLYNKGFVSALRGRDGKSLVAGEDTELTYALRSIGAKLHYNSKMQFQHFMPKARIRWAYLKKLHEAFGYSDYIVLPYEYYFLNRKFPTRRQQLFKVFKQYTHLRLSNLKHGFGEGHPNILTMHRRKGTLKAMVYGYKQHLHVRQIVAKLTAKSDEAN